MIVKVSSFVVWCHIQWFLKILGNRIIIDYEVNEFLWMSSSSYNTSSKRGVDDTVGTRNCHMSHAICTSFETKLSFHNSLQNGRIVCSTLWLNASSRNEKWFCKDHIILIYASWMHNLRLRVVRILELINHFFNIILNVMVWLLRPDECCWRGAFRS